MKKIFVAVMAMAAFVACSNEEQVAAPQGQAIAFGDAFVDNTTKAIYEGENKLTAFTVWGNVEGVALYGKTGATVSTGGDYNTIWTCSETRYWTPLCDFEFFATAHATVAANDVVNGIPTKFSYTADGTTDLLCSTAVAKAETDEVGAPTAVVDGSLKTIGDETVVAFTMKHLLSRIAFKYTVAAGVDPAYTYNVTNVKVSGGYASGVYTVADGVWSEQTGTMPDLTFTNIASDAFVIIPGAPALTISLTAEVVFGGEVISTVPYTVTLNKPDVEDRDFTFKAGNAYVFAVELPAPGKEIKFTVESVEDFGTPDNGNINIK